MSEQNDTDYLVEILYKVSESAGQHGARATALVVTKAAQKLKELHDRLTAIEHANAERSAINQAYYQQVIKETRDYGDD